jgi:hypothetical protein
MIPVVLIFSAAFVWRDSETLLLLNFLAICVSIAIGAYRLRSGSIGVFSLTESFVAGCFLITNVLAGFLLMLIKHLHWKKISDERQKTLGAWVRGTLLAVPPLILFVALFSSADAAFEGLLHRAIEWLPENLFSHLFLIAIFLWISGGILHQLFLSKDWNLQRAADVSSISIGSIEVTVLLGWIDLLFLIFVAIQIRYFFGGAALVETSATITYAEYARRGFFELVAVSALVLPLLLAAHWLIRNETGTSSRKFALFAGLMILLLFVIMASAWLRMRLYQEQYGLTEPRFYTTAFMGLLASLFVWFCLSVMRGKRIHFASGAIFIGLFWILVLNVINPDKRIVGANTFLLLESRRFDASYAASLSADSVPALLEAVPLMNQSDRSIVAKSLLSRWEASQKPDWRTWNWSRQSARKAVAKSLSLLQQAKTGMD